MHQQAHHLNIPQATLHLVNANKAYVLWGRATGKSNGGLGPRIVHLFDTMPGAQIGLTAPSYKMAFGQILPNIVGFWQNEMQLVEGEDYVIGRKPPDDWDKPLIPIMEYKYVISFDNGSCMPILSLEAEGTGNGFNLQANVGDEAKFFNEKKLKAEVLKAIRGGHDKFGHLPEFQSQWYFTDKYGGNIDWMLEKRKLMDPDLIAAVIKLQLNINEWQQQLYDTAPGVPSNPHTVMLSDSETSILRKRINQLTNKLNTIRKDLVFVSEASALENEGILGAKYFASQKEDSTAIEYDVAILNKDPDRTENSYYPGFTDAHQYTVPRAGMDVDVATPLIIAADYQWRISPIATAQYGVLPGATEKTLNFVHACYELHPLQLKDALDKWINHFKNHPTKIVYYLFDKTATNKSPTSIPYWEYIVQHLQNNGWGVIAENMGEPPRHDHKFRAISKYLDAGAPIKTRVNKITCEAMITSIKLAPAMQLSGKTAKDKRTEKNLSYPAVKSTHFSDVFDMVMVGCHDLQIVPINH